MSNISREFTINRKNGSVTIYTDPTMVLRIKKSKKDKEKITIELHSTINGRLSMDIYPDLLKTIINELE
ncbi:hypothetical protein J2Y67_001888 [Neobacillus niacini]|nr:hypothetical protein [Neobacillus niacini]